MNKVSGVYKITNTITGDFYIGSSGNIKHRWLVHRAPSKWAQCPNSKLYQDMIQYGRDNFIVGIIEETNNLKEREQYWIEQLKPTYNNYRANGIDIDRQKRTAINVSRSWHREHDKKLCVYNEETLTFSAIVQRFKKQGIAYPTQEAKKYLKDSN